MAKIVRYQGKTYRWFPTKQDAEQALLRGEVRDGEHIATGQNNFPAGVRPGRTIVYREGIAPALVAAGVVIAALIVFTVIAVLATIAAVIVAIFKKDEAEVQTVDGPGGRKQSVVTTEDGSTWVADEDGWLELGEGKKDFATSLSESSGNLAKTAGWAALAIGGVFILGPLVKSGAKVVDAKTASSKRKAEEEEPAKEEQKGEKKPAQKTAEKAKSAKSGKAKPKAPPMKKMEPVTT